MTEPPLAPGEPSPPRRDPRQLALFFALGALTVAPMAPLTDPGTADGRINLHFREKAFWTFSRGQRLGDLRRLVRNYGRAVNDVFPVGTHYRGGEYGTDVNLPVPTDERTNLDFKGCTDRKA